MSMSAFAQTWTAPTPQFVEPASEQSYYVYNTGSGRFLTHGNSWGTQATLGEEGLLMLVTETTDAAGNPGWTLLGNEEWVNDWNGACGFKYMFIVGANEVCMDMADQGHNFFNFIANGDGTYRIRTTEVDGWSDVAFGEGVYSAMFVGWNGVLNEDGSINDTHVYPFLDPVTDTKVGVDWGFVTPEAYPAFAARQALYATYLLAAAVPSVNTAAAAAVYNNPAATAEELNAANEALSLAVRNAKFDEASPENPIEVTEMIVNADCASSTGWTGPLRMVVPNRTSLLSRVLPRPIARRALRSPRSWRTGLPAAVLCPTRPCLRYSRVCPPASTVWRPT